VVCARLWYEVVLWPFRPIPSFRRALLSAGIEVSHKYIQRRFHEWGLTRKKASLKVSRKFSLSNIRYFYSYVLRVAALPVHQLVFVDESHFAAKDFLDVAGYSLQGRRLVGVSPPRLQESYSCLLATSLSATVPVSYRLNSFTTTALDFLLFIFDLLQTGFCASGGFILLDNARVHTAHYVRTELDDLLASYDVQLFFMPTYSPEVNPCEYVFSGAKTHIRNHHRNSDSFLDDIQLAFTNTVTQSKVENYYLKCVCDFDS